jgi:hypothetical protein
LNVTRCRGAPENVDLSNPLLAWRKLVYLWVGFVDPVTGAVLPPFQRLQAYDCDPATRDFITAKGRAYPDFIQYLKIEDVQRLFQELSLLLDFALNLPVALASVGFSKSQDGLPGKSEVNGLPVSGVATISFYQDGEAWKIGFFGEEKVFSHRKGFDFIRTLLQHSPREIACQDLYHGSAVPLHHAEDGPAQELSWEDKASGGYQVLGPDKQKLISQKDIPKIISTIEFLKEKKETLESSLNASSRETMTEVDEIDEQIRTLEGYIKQSRKSFSSQENKKRTNIRHQIRKAIEAILSKLPELAVYLSIDLPNRTIRTGHKCSYVPDPTRQVRWNLGPPFSY